MASATHQDAVDQKQFDEYAATVQSLQDDVSQLRDAVARLTVMVIAGDARAHIAHARADNAEERADAVQLRVQDLDDRLTVDRELIAELQADGAASRDHAEQLEKALRTSRTIGAAVGILMAGRQVGQDEALSILKQASFRANTPLRHLAAAIVDGQNGNDLRSGLRSWDGEGGNTSRRHRAVHPQRALDGDVEPRTGRRPR